jgi:hypothetical protein
MRTKLTTLITIVLLALIGIAITGSVVTVHRGD